MERNSKQFEALLRLHEGLPRQGPGSAVTTARALDLLPAVPPEARIYDLGCGPGHASMVLASRLKQKVVAVDLTEDFLLQVTANAQDRGLSDLIETRLGDMAALDDEPQSINLIWAEGSIYCVGFDQALSIWRPLLKSNGVVACTELSWLKDNPAAEASQFWQAAYPGARSVVQNITAAERIGYACLGHFVLPQSCWWDEYYDPLLANIKRLGPEAKDDQFLAQAIHDATAEIDLFKRFSADYGYVFYLLQKSDIMIEPATDSDAHEIARVFRRSFKTALPTIPTLHSEEEDRQYFSQKVLPQNNVSVARQQDRQIIGFIAFDKELVHHLYVLPDFMGKGIGGRLLRIAKAQRQRLRLWTFQKNTIAKRFYGKHGFVVIKETDGQDNEENEDDVLFEWVND